MDKIECYRRAMLAVLRSSMKDDAKLEVLAALMEARNIERDAAEWANSQALEGAQE